MVWWDRQFIRKVEDSNIPMELYARYVDDVNLAAIGVRPDSEENDKHTMEELQKIANSIHPSIRVTIDYPNNHLNKRLPVLDVEQWIEMVERDGVHKPQILHSHYMKGMTNRSVINKSSALSYKTKINILVADLVRVMRNVSLLATDNERKIHIEYFILRMQHSGYSTEERIKVYRMAKNDLSSC